MSLQVFFTVFINLIQQKTFVAKDYIDIAAMLERGLLNVTILRHYIYNAYKKQTLVSCNIT